MAKQYQDLLKKVEKINQKTKLDLSADEDLSLAVMNLVSIEEHLFFTGAKTNKNNYFDLLKEVREVRKSLLDKLLKNREGEIWCVSKHLLSASMRLIEVGTKELNQGRKKSAEDLFQKAYQLYSLFWGLNLKIVDPGKINKAPDRYGVLAKLGQVVQKIIDCCRE